MEIKMIKINKIVQLLIKCNRTRFFK